MNRYEYYANLQAFKKQKEENDVLKHYGIIGQKWGTRRWQNADGTFNQAGKERYFGTGKSKEQKINGTYYWSENKHIYNSDYQNQDGSLTKRGKKLLDKYENGDKKAAKKMESTVDLKMYDKFKEQNIKEDNKNQKIGSQPGSFDFKKINGMNKDSYGLSEDDYWKNKEKTEKYLDENYDKDFANCIKDDYDTTGEWGDVDAAYEEFKKDPLEYLRKYSRDPKYNRLTDKDIKKATKEAKKLEKRLEKADYGERRNIENQILKDEKYKDLFDEITENDNKKSAEAMTRTEEIFDGFEDEKNRNLALAGITNMIDFGYYPNPTMEDLANNAWFYVYEDGNQGDNTAEYLYATMEKGIKDNELSDLYNKLHVKKDSRDEGISTLKKSPVLKNINNKYLDEIVERKLEDNNYDNEYYWALYAANEGGGPNGPSDKTKNNYKTAKNIVKKLDKSCGNGDGWDFLNEAIENLDMSSKELASMTQSDWDKINAEINRLMS